MTEIHPDCARCLIHEGKGLIDATLQDLKTDLKLLDEQNYHSINNYEKTAQMLDFEYESRVTIGQKIADKVTAFGGSWTFLGLYASIILAWVSINSLHLFLKPFDPFPFIFLNLVLSALATFQAPVILMSQNRQDRKDRLRAEHDFKTNLKTEMEVRHLNLKLDLMLSKYMERLLEIQNVQMTMLNRCSEQSCGTKDE